MIFYSKIPLTNTTGQGEGLLRKFVLVAGLFGDWKYLEEKEMKECQEK